MDRIVLPGPLYMQIVRHVTRVAPAEAVGIIGELADGRAHVVIELPNLTGPDEFFADPFAQYQAERRLSREGLRIIAIYHSHPGGGTELSDADRLAGAQWNCAHIVVVPERSPDDANYMRAWRVAGSTDEMIPIIREME
jgi:proteasome lid subunit RPN8/RPN11